MTSAFMTLNLSGSKLSRSTRTCGNSGSGCVGSGGKISSAPLSITGGKSFTKGGSGAIMVVISLIPPSNKAKIIKIIANLRLFKRLVLRTAWAD